MLTKSYILISKKPREIFFYTKFNLDFFFNLINIYLSNVDIFINRLLLNKGQQALEVFVRRGQRI